MNVLALSGSLSVSSKTVALVDIVLGSSGLTASLPSMSLSAISIIGALERRHPSPFSRISFVKG